MNEKRFDTISVIARKISNGLTDEEAIRQGLNVYYANESNVKSYFSKENDMER